MTGMMSVWAGATAANRRPPSVRSGVNSGTITAATLTTTTGIPSGTRTGDVLVTSVGVASTADTIATPSGWAAAFAPQTTLGTGTNRKSYLFTRTATGGADDDPTWTKTGTASTWSVSTGCVGATSGLDVSNVNVLNGAADTSPILPQVTPTVGFVTLVAVVVPFSSTLTTPSIHWVNAFTGAAGNPRHAFSRRGPWPAGTISPADTFSVTVASKWVTYVLAFKRQ